MVPRVGQRIGPYEILGRLGSGGMGLVFSAWDARLQRDVAIKLLRDEYATPDMRSRFLQEARAASGLNHPNICTIFDIGEQGGDPYLVMELLKGETLRARITSGTISPDDIIRVASEVADALTVAHTRGIIHRDIKPANIILVDKPGGRFGTKVLDFGLAKVDMGDGHERFDLTSIGSTVGTVSYMSPEQARGEPLDARSDLFSLGVVLYEMATGMVPFRGATSALVFVQLLSQPPEMVREINAAIPKDLERVILKLLEKDRALRYQSAGELVDALNRTPVRGSTAGKSIWGTIPSLVRSARPESSSVRDAAPEVVPSPVPKKPESEKPTPKPPMGESILRPVRRIVTTDPLMPVPEYSSPAPTPQIAPVPRMSAPNEPPPSSSRPVAAAPTPLAPPSQPMESSTPAAAPSSSASGSIPGSGSEAIPKIPSILTAGSSASKTPVPMLTPLQRSSQRLPTPRFQRLEDDDDDLLKPAPKTSTPKVASGTRRTHPWLLAGSVVVVAGLVAAFFWPRHGAAVTDKPTTLVLASLTNRTGDDILSGVLAAGLRFDLEQSTQFAVRDSSALVASLHALDLTPSGELPISDARRAGEAIGASQLLYGEVKSDGSSYTVALRSYDVVTGASADETETAASREQLPDAIDRLASDVRLRLGESADLISKTDLPLSKDASSSLDALAAYAAGEQMLEDGHFVDAMHTLERSVQADPHFTQGYLQLADLYRKQHASTAAAQAANQAMANSTATGDRTKLLAEASQALNSTGDLAHATSVLQELLNKYPQDIESGSLLAVTLRLQGRFTESLEVAQRVLARSPYDQDAASATEAAMLALDRTEAAAQVEAQIQKSGHSHPGLRVLINYLGSRDNGQVGVDLSGDADRYGGGQYQAEVLDAGGLLNGGLQAWRTLVAGSGSNGELSSSAGEELTLAALDRALVGDCAAAQGLLKESATYSQGADGLFNGGMTASLCGNQDLAKQQLAAIRKGYPQSFAAKGFYDADLAAVIAWRSGDAAGALKTLQTAKQYDLLSLTPYLRGLIHLKAGQPQAAIVDFQGMLEHRGATTLANPVLFALAQIGVARSYQTSGDQGNSATAYRKFLALWSAADSGQEMVREAKAGAH